MTAVIFFADDLFNASMQSKSSIRLSLAGDETDWIIKILFPSYIFINSQHKFLHQKNF
jgi:hypothetical protein